VAPFVAIGSAALPALCGSLACFAVEIQISVKIAKTSQLLEQRNQILDPGN
jgi:hypothetical protein